MILALSRFRVKNAMAAQVRAAFERRPRRVEGRRGFHGLEVFSDASDPGAFLLLTRWSDESSFREWHHSPEHHASHRLIPPGLKLDASGTELIVAERIAGATSGGAEGEVLIDGALAFARLLAEGSSIHFAALDFAGRVLLANRALTRLLGRELVGVPIDELVIEQSRSVLRAACASDRSAGFTLLNVLGPQQEPISLRCLIEPFRGGHLLIGEPPFDHQRELEEQLQSLNAELVVLARENARQARAIKAANKELHEAHWHIKKIAQVLPMCLVCRKVRTGPQTWEDIVCYLLRSTDFLSHGYCAGCADRLIADLQKEEKP